jgi:hypothetical protein
VATRNCREFLLVGDWYLDIEDDILVSQIIGNGESACGGDFGLLSLTHEQVHSPENKVGNSKLYYTSLISRFAPGVMFLQS